MNTVQEIESAVAKLSREELSAFRDWFQSFDAEAWDGQFEADEASGQPEVLADGRRTGYRVVLDRPPSRV
jgi:hypothetical protein